MGLFNPGIGATGLQRVLGSLRGANFNSTADQAIPIPSAVTKFIPTGFIVTNASVSMTTAVGGFYAAASKASPIVAATQNYVFLTTATASLFVQPTPAASASITPGASVFSYVNNDGVPENVVITGGTVSAITLTRGGFTSANVATTTPYVADLFPFDAVNVTYTVVPTMTKFPAWQPAASNAVASLFLSLTTPQGAAATADVYAVGIDLT